MPIRSIIDFVRQLLPAALTAGMADTLCDLILARLGDTPLGNALVVLIQHAKNHPECVEELLANLGRALFEATGLTADLAPVQEELEIVNDAYQAAEA